MQTSANIFGAENRVNVGYRYNYYDNDEITLDDSKIQTPYANVTYWFDVKKRWRVHLCLTLTRSTLGMITFLVRVITRQTMQGCATCGRFTPNSTGYVGYNYATYDYERILPQDFDVHSGLVGLDIRFRRVHRVRQRGILHQSQRDNRQ